MEVRGISAILYRKMICLLTVVAFAGQMIIPSSSFAEIISSSPAMNFPQVGAMVNLSDTYQPALIRGMQIFPDNPFRFDFIVDAGDSGLNETTLKEEADRLVRYFYASLTTPEKELWVNLSPYESDRIVPDSFGVTEMGRDLLAQDYLLKQITASLMYPEGETGKAFWERVYQKANELYGTTDVPLDTFNKVWIVPDQAGIYVEDDKVFVVDSHLKVMLEEDYVAMSQSDNVHMSDDQKAKREQLKLMKDVVRDVMIPEIEREINEGQNFATLRQVYNSLILAAWFKRNLKESILGQAYVDQNKILGIDLQDKSAKQNIYDRYLQAFQQGVYNYIKEEYDPTTQNVIPKKYFSGGVNLAMLKKSLVNEGFSEAVAAFRGPSFRVSADGKMMDKRGVVADAAMMSAFLSLLVKSTARWVKAQSSFGYPSGVIDRRNFLKTTTAITALFQACRAFQSDELTAEEIAFLEETYDTDIVSVQSDFFDPYENVALYEDAEFKGRMKFPSSVEMFQNQIKKLVRAYEYPDSLGEYLSDFERPWIKHFNDFIDESNYKRLRMLAGIMAKEYSYGFGDHTYFDELFSLNEDAGSINDISTKKIVCRGYAHAVTIIGEALGLKVYSYLGSSDGKGWTHSFNVEHDRLPFMTGMLDATSYEGKYEVLDKSDLYALSEFDRTHTGRMQYPIFTPKKEIETYIFNADDPMNVKQKGLGIRYKKITPWTPVNENSLRKLNVILNKVWRNIGRVADAMENKGEEQSRKDILRLHESVAKLVKRHNINIMRDNFTGERLASLLLEWDALLKKCSKRYHWDEPFIKSLSFELKQFKERKPGVMKFNGIEAELSWEVNANQAMMSEVVFGSEKQRPVLPEGWTFLVHNTHLAKSEWNSGYLALQTGDDLVVNQSNGLFTSPIENEEDLNIFFEASLKDEGLLKALLRKGDRDQYDLRNFHAQIRVIFPQEKLEVGEEHIKELMRRYYSSHLANTSGYPVVPKGERLIKVAQIIEDVDIGGVVDKVKVFYFVPEGLKEVYENLVGEQNRERQQVGPSVEEDQIFIDARGQDQFQKGEEFKKTFEYQVGPKMKMLQGGDIVRPVKADDVYSIFLFPDQVVRVSAESIDAENDLNRVTRPGAIYRELDIEFGNKIADLGVVPPIVSFGVIKEISERIDRWTDSYYFVAVESVIPKEDIAPQEKWRLINQLLEKLFRNNIFIEQFDLEDVLIGSTPSNPEVKAYMSNFQILQQETKNLSQHIDLFLSESYPFYGWEEFDLEGEILRFLNDLKREDAAMLGKNIQEEALKVVPNIPFDQQVYLNKSIDRIAGGSFRDFVVKYGYVFIDGIYFDPMLPKNILQKINNQVFGVFKDLRVMIFDYGDSEVHGNLVSFGSIKGIQVNQILSGDIDLFQVFGEAYMTKGVNHVVLHELGHNFWKYFLNEVERSEITSRYEIKSAYGKANRSIASDEEENFCEQFASAWMNKFFGKQSLTDQEVDIELQSLILRLYDEKINGGSNAAMLNAQQKAQMAFLFAAQRAIKNQANKGGIDLNPDLLKINQNGDAQTIMKPVANQLLNKDFIGVVPFIIDIKPLNISTILTGKSREKSSETAQNTAPQTAFLKE